MDTNETNAVRRGPGRPRKDDIADTNPAPAAPVMDKAMAPVGMEVVILKPYRPSSDEMLIERGRATEGVSAKLLPGETVELPMDEAKRAIRAGIATFPTQEV